MSRSPEYTVVQYGYRLDNGEVVPAYGVLDSIRRWAAGRGVYWREITGFNQVVDSGVLLAGVELRLPGGHPPTTVTAQTEWVELL